MQRSAHLVAGALAAVYLLWLAAWIVFDTAVYAPAQHHGDQAAAAGLTALVALHAARRRRRPYAGFLALQGLAFVALAAAWLSYGGAGYPAAAAAADGPPAVADLVYAASVFALLCAWGYLALARWPARPLSALTTTVFVLSMAGLGAIFASFYVQQYLDQLGSASGRLYAVTAGLEFAVLVAGLFGLLQRLPPALVCMFVGTVVLMAGDMVFSLDEVPPLIEPVWMAGQFLVLAAALVMARAPARDGERAAPADDDPDDAQPRSGISGVLILVSLGAVLVSPLVWFLPLAAVWKSFFSALFVVALVVILVWITDRFDDAVAYLRQHVRDTLASRLRAPEWRRSPARVRSALGSTGLGGFLDGFGDAAARLRRDVLFLGPERLFGPPRERGGARPASCFLVMPFGQPWSAEVHRILARACDAAGVRAVRGDDLFTPTDILEDIWQGLHGADFVIADITGRNPNVLYELGIAHALAKPVLIVSRQAADIPIDLATRRVIVYGQSELAWREDLADRIAPAVAAIVRDYGLAALPPPARPAPAGGLPEGGPTDGGHTPADGPRT